MKMSLKTKRMKEILDPIATQINKLDDILSKNVNNSLEIESAKSELLKHLNLLSDKLKNLSNDETNDYQKTKDNITAMIEDFCCSKKIPNSENIKATSASDILNNFTSALQLLEDLECFEIKLQLQDAFDYVKEMGEINEIEDYQNIKELGTNILEILTPLQLYGKNIISKLHKNKLSLYICQLCTTFTMLAQLVEEQHNINLPIYNTKKYICERTCWCFKMIINILDNKNSKEIDNNYDDDEEEEEDENHFVYKMDLALDMISKFSDKKPDEQKLLIDDLWISIEDVFSHAMVIAQVCQPDDFKAITGVSQTIMSEFENLKEQITSNKPDPMLNSLLINTFTDALYRLERKVNISVLSLVMEVFMDPCCGLKKLIQLCGNTLSVDKRNKNDLNNAIEIFDQITDKIMLIGLYAISSCGDINRVNKIKNYLASLESLDTELVPTIISFYLHPDNKEIRTGVKLLTNQWKYEIKKLYTAINLIIDSSAYCDVVLDNLQNRVAIMNDFLDNHRVINKTQIQEIVQRACTLVTQITDTIDDIGHENIEQQTKMTIRELKAAIFEIVAASEQYLNDIVTEPLQLKIIKRCELLVSVIKNLQPALIILMNNSHSIKTINDKSQINHAVNYRNGSRLNVPSSTCKSSFNGKKSITYVRTPYTVMNFKPHVSIQRANSIPKSPVNMSSLIPYIKKGYDMRNEKSIMYKTPKNTDKKKKQIKKNSEFNSRNYSSIRQHLFSRDSIEQHNSLDLSNESFDLTNILEKITGLSSSLDSTIKS